MLSDQDIVKAAHQHIQENLLVTAWWRANEIRDNYGLYEGSQWLQEDYSRQIANNAPTRTINRIQTILDAIAGFEIQNRSEIKTVPRILSEEQQNYTDLANDGIKWIEDTSRYGIMKSLAFTDMMISGLGFVDVSIAYDQNNDYGKVRCERIFPYFMMWDVTTRNKNLEEANWICRAKIIDREELAAYMKGMTPDDMDAVDAEFGCSVDARFLDFFDTVMVTKSLGVIYNYQWREKVNYYQLENPLKGYEGDPNDPHTMQIVDLAKLLKEKYGCNPYYDAIIPVEKDELKEVKDLFAMLGFEKLTSIKRKKFKYYRADIVGFKVINKSENYSQNGFSIQTMTGKYDEIRQCYYGLVRSMKEPQRLLNQVVSDYEQFLRTIPKGGVNIEADAVPNLEGFRDTYLKASQITIFSPGALSSGKVIPKVAPPIPEGMLEMIELSNRFLMDVVGVTPDFMGMADSKLMTAQLNSQLVRQGLMVLAPYFDAVREFTKHSGLLFIDCLRILVDNAEGQLIGHITPEGKRVSIPLLNENLADQYDIVIEDVPMTPDQRQETFEKLLQLSSVLMQGPNPVNIMPIVMEYAPLDAEQLGAVKTMMQPPPPQEPDPLQTAMLQSETEARSAQAEKNRAETMKINIETLLKQKELERADDVIDADLMKQMASAKHDLSTTAKNLREANNPAH